MLRGAKARLFNRRQPHVHGLGLRYLILHSDLLPLPPPTLHPSFRVHLAPLVTASFEAIATHRIMCTNPDSDVGTNTEADGPSGSGDQPMDVVPLCA